MRKKYLITIPALAAMLTCTSCNDWLDVMPDNRAEIDSSEKVYKLLVSAYPEISHTVQNCIQTIRMISERLTLIPTD